ncbi:MAG: hypothetical protein FWD81_03335 [Methanomassiliicoccaceae archaeon]|nr:hypothetical protein [Methanomassiliicoccaceae archaeon]
MEERPIYVVVASTLALIGAFFALMVTISGLRVTEDGLELRMGFCLLSLILFIAVAGSLSSNGQWSWRFLIFMQVLCTAVPILAHIFGVIDFPFTVTLVILSCLMIVFTTTQESRRWIEADRV